MASRGRAETAKEGRNLIKLAKSTEEISFVCLFESYLIMRQNLILAFFISFHALKRKCENHCGDDKLVEI